MAEPNLHTVELYRDTQQLWRWRRKAGNGEIISSGEAYTTKGAALDGLSLANSDTDRYRFVDLT